MIQLTFQSSSQTESGLSNRHKGFLWVDNEEERILQARMTQTPNTWQVLQNNAGKIEGVFSSEDIIVFKVPDGQLQITSTGLFKLLAEMHSDTYLKIGKGTTFTLTNNSPNGALNTLTFKINL